MNLIQKLSSQIEQQGLWENQITLKRSEFLRTSNSIDTNLYYITEGSLRMFVIDDSEEHTIRFAYQNDFITSLDAFITERPSAIFTQALKKTHLKVISKKVFMSFIKQKDDNQLIWTQILEQLILQQFEREVDILTSSPLERYKRVFNRSPQLFQEIPHKYIASYLRMTPETLSRIKKY